MSENDLWSPNQCGFKSDHRTADNLFILNALYQKYTVNMRQKLYLAFEDFRKFFDCLNRKFLLYKLFEAKYHG